MRTPVDDKSIAKLYTGLRLITSTKLFLLKNDSVIKIKNMIALIPCTYTIGNQLAIATNFLFICFINAFIIG